MTDKTQPVRDFSAYAFAFGLVAQGLGVGFIAGFVLGWVARALQ